jgi:hypothetical protein
VPSSTSLSAQHLLSTLEEKASHLSSASDQLNAAFDAVQKRPHRFRYRFGSLGDSRYNSDLVGGGGALGYRI